MGEAGEGEMEGLEEKEGTVMHSLGRLIEGGEGEKREGEKREVPVMGEDTYFFEILENYSVTLPAT